MKRINDSERSVGVDVSFYFDDSMFVKSLESFGLRRMGGVRNMKVTELLIEVDNAIARKVSEFFGNEYVTIDYDDDSTYFAMNMDESKILGFVGQLIDSSNSVTRDYDRKYVFEIKNTDCKQEEMFGLGDSEINEISNKTGMPFDMVVSVLDAYMVGECDVIIYEPTDEIVGKVDEMLG